jgi:hypothetical protein
LNVPISNYDEDGDEMGDLIPDDTDILAEIIEKETEKLRIFLQVKMTKNFPKMKQKFTSKIQIPNPKITLKKTQKPPILTRLQLNFQ